MAPKTLHKYVVFMEESMMYVDEQGKRSKTEDEAYTRAHEIVRATLRKVQPFGRIVNRYEPKERRAFVTFDKKLIAALKANTEGIVAKIEVAVED